MPNYKQNQSAELLPDGIYPFYVKSAKLSTSQNGNEKIELTLQVNGLMTIYDNLTFTDSSFWKIDQFRVATGEVLGAAGSDASLEADDCLQRRGEVEIGENEFPSGSGRIRNVVIGYIDPKRVVKAGSEPQKTKPAEPDNIPF